MTTPGLFEFLAHQPLLLLAMAAIFVSVLGGKLRASLPRLGGVLNGIGSLGLIAALLLTVAEATRHNGSSDVALAAMGMPEQVVSGGETRVPLSRDGHFWIRAAINGEERRFLVDTGATLTAISPDTAMAAQVSPRQLGRQVMLRTANGTVPAELVTITELRFGNVVARDLDAVVAPGIGETNVIGMNLLSRLASWRVDGRTLVLVPKAPPDLIE